MKKVNLLPDEKELAKQLGLSNDEIDVFEYLSSIKKSRTAKDISGALDTYPTAIYRLLYDLEKAGMIERVGGRPKSFRAFNKKKAFSQAVELSRKQLEDQLKKLNFHKDGQESVHAELIIGRQAQYDRFNQEVSKTKIDICDHSIGIAYSDEMYAVIKSAMKRGVRFRFVFQQYKASNFSILHKWKELGLELRHYRAKRGFHITIFDGNRMIVTFSDPDNTDDRLSIFTDNEIAIRIFCSYFESLWLLSKKVEV